MNALYYPINNALGLKQRLKIDQSKELKSYNKYYELVFMQR